MNENEPRSPQMHEPSSYTQAFLVDQSPEAVFLAINNVRGWWSDISGSAEKVGDRFTHRVMNLHRCDVAVTELRPGELVLWTVLDNYFNFTKDESEWRYTNIVFEISKVGPKTKLTFTHIGLVPRYECYEVCVDGWQTYLDSLRLLLTTGKGNPNVGAAQTKSEQQLARGA